MNPLEQALVRDWLASVGGERLLALDIPPAAPARRACGGRTEKRVMKAE
ncbi:MAG: hypothetical protein IPG16_19270 [Comamonadaceae bacterium]|nr:hypothetical protein [Comamonadaceae bacterium]